MTTLTAVTVTKDSPGAGQFTIVGTYADTTFTTQAQQQSINNFPATNKLWSRAFRIATDALFVMRNGANSVAITAASLAKIAFTMESTLTYIPRILTQPADGSCVASSTAANFVVSVSSELSFTYQWQYETKASGTVTTDNTELADGDTITVNGQVYRFKDTMAQAYDVKRNGTTADTTLANFIKAINGTGTPGSEYFAGTVAHPTALADGSVVTHVVTLRARLSGTAGNSLALAKSAAHLSVSGAVFSGGGTWSNASGTVNGCAYANGTTTTLTATPTTTVMSGTEHRCVATNSIGATTTDSVTLTIT